ncbi:hypothetical protein EDC18_105165 [Natranaerovirga pectinivora]|uniref:YkoP-like domain-containing protein n=1 Tax=Natranaerovirga pectinivora TaxID=682400 RepID=A0A4V2V091_9FIRM|nr:hypothetical protein [Natranaerovirga pectinivora]TCT14683.1 hypothetical protein EDC18_105165 [Natranaerovirga pectinivora]
MRKFLRKVFVILDNIVRKLGKWELIPNTRLEYFYLSKHRYKGKDKILEDGSIIKKGDEVIEMHVNNSKMEELGSRLKEIFKALDEELRLLAIALEENEKYKNVKGLWARTVLYPITEKRGFETQEIKGTYMFGFLKIWDNLIKYAFEQKEGKIKLRDPKEIWISKTGLIKINLKN